MVQPSGKSSSSFGSMTCSLPILAVTAATLAIFLGVVITPWLGLPLRSTIQSYISEAGLRDHSKNADFISHDNSQLVNVTDNSTVTAYISGKNHNREEIVHPKPTDEGISNQSAAKPKRKAYNGDMSKNETVKQFPLSGNPSISTNSSLQPSEKQLQSIITQAPSGSHDDLQNKSAITVVISTNDNKTKLIVLPPPISSENGTTKVITSASSTGKCDLFQGKWVHDSLGPLYKNDSCPVLTEAQNCQGNGRPDKDYENWRWQPTSCDLPRFDAHKFLELMHGKTLAFVGDSVARNQMESMMCILWQTLARGLTKTNTGVEMMDLNIVDIQDMIECISRCAGVVIMAPPSSGPANKAITTIYAAVKPKQPVVIAESYGGDDEPVDTIAQRLVALGISLPIPPLRIKEIPNEAIYQQFEEAGTDLGQLLSQKKSIEAKKAGMPINVAKAIARISGGLYVVTAAKGSSRGAMVASWVSQASFKPLGITIAVAKDRAIESLMQVGDTFVLNCLEDGNYAPLMKHFLKRFPAGADRFEGVQWVPAASNGSPILTDCIAYLECRVAKRMETSDHWIAYSHVTDGNVSNSQARTASHHRKIGNYY